MSQVPICHSSSRAAYRRLAGNATAQFVFFFSLMILGLLTAVPLTLLGTIPVLQHVKAVRQLAAASSPLQGMVVENSNLQFLGEDDMALVQKIVDQSSLEYKTLFIAETVVPAEEWEKLQEFVKSQLAANQDIVFPKQAAAMMEMVRLNPRESSLAVESVGEGGSLSNSLAVALIKQHEENIHYMLMAVKAEPHLGVWKRLSKAERNSWNTLLSKLLADKVNAEVKNYFLSAAQASPIAKTLSNAAPQGTATSA